MSFIKREILMSNEDMLILLTQDYTLIHATTPHEFNNVKQLRKEVFSKKFNLSSSQLEKEGYLFNEEDEQSFLYLLKHNSSNTYVGSVRVFFINNKTPLKHLTMQSIGKVKNIEHLTQGLPLAEISRMCLKNTLPIHEKYSVLQVRTCLAYALMVMTRINFFLYKPTNIFATMEPTLERILSRKDVCFTQISEPIEYYGTTIPYAVNRNDLLNATEESMGKVTRFYLKKLCENPRTFWKYIDTHPYLNRSDIEIERMTELLEQHGEDVDISLLLGQEISPA